MTAQVLPFAAALAALDATTDRVRTAAQRVAVAADETAADIRATRRVVTSGVRAWTRDSRPVPRVLVVDDLDAVRDGLIAALHAAGVDAVGAATMDEARSLLVERPAVLVVDVYLGREGLALPLLVARDPLTRALVVSAHTDTDALRNLARVAHAEWMPRPMTSDALVRLVTLVRRLVQEATT